MRHDRDSAEGLSDEYGPMTDLIFSLFFVAILLLGMVGVDASITRQSLIDRLTAEENKVQALQSAQARPETRAPAVTLPQPEPPKDPGLTPVYGRLELGQPIAPPTGESGFLTAGALDETTLEEIRTSLGEALGNLEKLDANRILVEIDIAANLGAPSTASATDADYTDALATGAALTQALRRTPMPLACIVPVPYGNVRSNALTVFTTKPSMNDRLDAFEAGNRDNLRTASRETLAGIGAADTRIRLVAEHVYTSPCAAEDLMEGIARWSEGDLIAPR